MRVCRPSREYKLVFSFSRAVFLPKTMVSLSKAFFVCKKNVTGVLRSRALRAMLIDPFAVCFHSGRTELRIIAVG